MMIIGDLLIEEDIMVKLLEPMLIRNLVTAKMTEMIHNIGTEKIVNWKMKEGKMSVMEFIESKEESQVY